MSKTKTSANSQSLGTTLTGCSVTNQAAPVAPEQAEALKVLAEAAIANANAIAKIADALKGAEAHMHAGFSFGG